MSNNTETREQDFEKEWTGMPEFVQPKKTEFVKIIVRFRNQEDLDEFAKSINQKLTSKSKSIWYPPLVSDKNIMLRYLDDES